MSNDDPVVVCTDPYIRGILQGGLDTPLKDVIIPDNVQLSAYAKPTRVTHGRYVYTPETGICTEFTFYNPELTDRVPDGTTLRHIRNPLSNTINVYVSHGTAVLIHVDVRLAARTLHIPVYVKLGDNVLEVKRVLYSISGLKIDQQRLLFSGRQLLGDRTLEDQGVLPCSTLTLIARLRSGQVFYVSTDSEYCSTIPPPPVTTLIGMIPVYEMGITTASGHCMLYVHPDTPVETVNEYILSLVTHDPLNSIN